MAGEGSRAYSSSPKPPVTRSQRFDMASIASEPLALMVISVPGPAASIIRPMIDVAPTVSLTRVTVTEDLYFSAICTNLAEARACRPFLLTISTTRVMASSPGALIGRSFSGQNTAGDGAILAAGILRGGNGLLERA